MNIKKRESGELHRVQISHSQPVLKLNTVRQKGRGKHIIRTVQAPRNAPCAQKPCAVAHQSQAISRKRKHQSGRLHMRSVGCRQTNTNQNSNHRSAYRRKREHTPSTNRLPSPPHATHPATINQPKQNPASSSRNLFATKNHNNKKGPPSTVGSCSRHTRPAVRLLGAVLRPRLAVLVRWW